MKLERDVQSAILQERTYPLKIQAVYTALCKSMFLLLSRYRFSKIKNKKKVLIIKSNAKSA